MSNHHRRLSKLRLPILLVAVAAGTGLAASCGGHDGDDGVEDFGTPGGGETVPLDCSMPRPGCACDNEGIKVVCGQQVGMTGDQVVCGKGISTCTDGEFTACVVDNSITLGSGFSNPLTLGTPVECPDPCDPYCWTFNDDPSGECDIDSGVCEGDGGITLDPDGAIVPPNVCTIPGVSGTCAHHICELGGPLGADCDEAAEPIPNAPPSGTVVVWSEDFSDNSAGWTTDGEWEIGSATTSSGHTYGGPDTGTDATTSTSDNGLAGVTIGGNASTTAHGYHYLTSPALDLSAENDPITLRYFRWLNSDYAPNMENVVEVFDGTNWLVVWQSSGTSGVQDSQWAQMVHNVTAHKNSAFQVRFGFQVGGGNVFTVSGWNIDEITIEAAQSTIQPPNPDVGGSCVNDICAVDPSCCNSAWTQTCVDMVDTVCGVTCMCDEDGLQVACYEDKFDHDGDGYSHADGDCFDCDINQNPGAFDFPGNGIDEDCSGTIDDEDITCGYNTPMTTLNAYNYAFAIDLCETAPYAQPNVAMEWGVLYAALVQADNAQSPNTKAMSVKSTFGTNNVPFKGPNMAVFSSGAARAPGDPGYVNPSGQFGSYNQGESAIYPTGFPSNAQGCPDAFGNANDSAGLWLEIRTPTNAKSFSYNFQYLSSEYPEWVCTVFDDHFVALLGSDQTNGNISLDANGNPVSVNNGLFTVPGCPTCTHPTLTGTGFGDWCGSQVCGGSTDWLVTQAPITPGEQITMHFSIWDSSDHVWDSLVLIDNWTWSPNDATVNTGQQPPVPPPEYQDGYFIRDYDASGICPQGTNIVWGTWSWQTSTPDDSYIDFFVGTADTLNGLATAPTDAVLFTDPPGPGALNGSDAIAQASPVDTQTGGAVVDEALLAAGYPRNHPYLRIISHLAPSGDKYSAPTLMGWNMTFDCLPNE